MLDDATDRTEVRYPISFAQERMWLLENLAPSGVLYGMPVVLRLVGALDTDLLARCLTELVRRHEVLRLCIREDRGRPAGVLRSAEPLHLPVRDLRQRDPAEVDDVLAACVSAPFDLARGPLLRVSLLRTADREHLLLLDFHHCVFDGLSARPLLVELGELYEAGMSGRPARLPRLPLRFADHVTAERERAAGGGFDDDLAYWTTQLAGAPTGLALPAHGHRDVAAQPGARHRFTLPDRTRDGLHALCRRFRVSPFMVALATWSLVLARYTGQDDVLIATPTAGRVSPESNDLIGLFVNTVVLRTGHDPSAPFSDLLAQCRRVTLEALLHQEVPVSRVVDALDAPREPGRNPLFQTVLTFEEDPWPDVEFGGIAVHHHPEPPSDTAKFDVGLQLVERAGRLEAELEYRVDVLSPAIVRRLAGHVTTLLDNAAAAPDRPVAQLSMITGPERRALLAAGHGRGPAAEPERRPLHEVFACRAATHPDAPAVTHDEVSRSYGDLDTAANRLAHELLARGVVAGAPVAVLLPRSADLVVAVLAVLKAGAYFVPLDVHHPVRRNRLIVEDVGAALVLTNQASVAAVPPGPVVLVLDDADLRAAVAAREPAPPASQVPASAPAYAIHTSGSTGRPKGVLVPHAAVTRLFTATAADFAFTDGQVWTWFHSPAFDFSVWEVWGALLHGGRLVVVPRETAVSPARLLDLLALERVTLVSQTPSAFDGLAREVARRDLSAPPPDLRYVVFGGERLDCARLRDWFARFGERRPRLVNMYGITEITVHATLRVLRRSDVDAGVSPIGGPLRDLRVHLLDESLEPVPVGVPGEIHVGGPGVALGYLNRPGLTARRFVPDPHSPEPGGRLYRSGDLARRREDGDLDYLGRADQQVKIRGHRVEPGEVAAALHTHPAVEQAYVLAVPRGGETRLVGYVITRAEVTSDRLRDHLARSLPSYLVPDSYVRLDRFPLTANGKVDRARLAAVQAPDLPAAGSRTPPRTDLERRLAAVWRTVLGRAELGVEDDFFASGGHSLAALRLAAEAADALGRPVDPALVFQAPTVRAMADQLSAGPDPDHSGPLVTLRPGDAATALLLVPPVGGGLLGYANLVHRLGGDLPVLGLQGTHQLADEIPGLAATYANTVERAGLGPVVLVGWSLGGCIAFELAQQLVARGHPVASVVVIDGAASFRGTLAAGGTLPHRFLDDLVASTGGTLVAEPHVVDALVASGGFAAVLTDREIAAALPPGLSATELTALYDRFRGDLSAADRHRPARRHDVPVTLVRADRETDPDPDLGWGELTGTAVPIRWVAGDHYSILREPAVAEVAEEITTALSRAGSRT
jgi:amino acid adenylation domain-containing protein